MDVTQILSSIDAEISRLQQARQAVAALDGASPIPARRPGRPKGSQNAAPAAAAAAEATPRKRKRNLSPEGRKRIQEAMKRRWAERHKGDSKDGSK